MSEDQQPSLRQIIRALETLEETHTARVQSVRDEYAEYANRERRQREYADRMLFKRDIHVDVLKETVEGLVETINSARTKLKKDLNDCVMSEPQDILRLLGKHDLVLYDITWKAWGTTQERFRAEMAKDADLGQETDAEKLQARVQELEQAVLGMRRMALNAIDGNDEMATAMVIISDMGSGVLHGKNIPDEAYPCATCGAVEGDHVGYVLGHNYTSGREDQS